MNDGPLILLIIIMLFLGAIFGKVIGEGVKELEWRDNLVDRLEYVEAVKKEVLAERHVKKLREQSRIELGIEK